MRFVQNLTKVYKLKVFGEKLWNCHGQRSCTDIGGYLDAYNLNDIF